MNNIEQALPQQNLSPSIPSVLDSLPVEPCFSEQVDFAPINTLPSDVPVVPAENVDGLPLSSTQIIESSEPSSGKSPAVPVSGKSIRAPFASKTATVEKDKEEEDEEEKEEQEE